MFSRFRISLAVLLLGLAAVFSAGVAFADEPAPVSDTQQLLVLHHKVLQAHRDNDVDALVGPSSDDFVVGSRGQVLFPTKEERASRLGPYLAQTRFSAYRDLVPPVVRVSEDGTLGWVICQVGIEGTRTMPSGEEHPVDSTWAWIELYEKRDGNWVSVGNVSSMKPVE